jgi:hypothetical protein
MSSNIEPHIIVGEDFNVFLNTDLDCSVSKPTVQKSGGGVGVRARAHAGLHLSRKVWCFPYTVPTVSQHWKRRTKKKRKKRSPYFNMLRDTSPSTIKILFILISPAKTPLYCHFHGERAPPASSPSNLPLSSMEYLTLRSQIVDHNVDLLVLWRGA